MRKYHFLCNKYVSSDFQKIIRDLANISEKLEIKSIGEELILNVLVNLLKQKYVN